MRTPLSLCLVLATACGGGADASRVDSARPGAATATRPPRPAPAGPEDRAPLAPRPGARALRVRLARDTSTFGAGALVATFPGGDSVQVADSAVRAWRLGDGTLVAWSGLDGAGGYEGEGQSLSLLDVATGARRRVLADYFVVRDVTLAQDGTARALVVHMTDGGVGSLHVAVVDPARGTVFRVTNARARVLGPRIVVESFGDGEHPVTMTDPRTPIRRDTLAVAALGAMPVLLVPRTY
jgi:hypothetical protein